MAGDGYGFGERIPELGRPDPSGTERFLYDLIGGAPAVLALAPPTGTAAPALAAFASSSSPVPRVVVCLAADAAAQQLPTLVDDGKALAFLRGGTAPAAGLVLLALDPNQRVVARRDAADATAVEAALVELAGALALPAWTPSGALGGGAPALIIPRVFEPELCAELIALFERDGGVPSQVFRVEGGAQVWGVDPGQKMRRDYQRFDLAWNRRFAELIRRRVLPEVDKCFAFRATGFEAFKLSRYDAGDGGYHRPHRDNVSRDVQSRRFAMSINLNSGDYEGGQLRFPEYGPELYLPPRGGAVVFSCSMLHEAMPVTRGSRYVFLTFLDDDKVRGPHLYHAPR